MTCATGHFFIDVFHNQLLIPVVNSASVTAPLKSFSALTSDYINGSRYKQTDTKKPGRPGFLLIYN